MKKNNWLDVRNHKLVRLGLAVPRIRLSDPQFNAQAHCELAKQMSEQGAIVAAFAELGLTGYSNYNLFHQDTLLMAALRALQQVTDGTADMDMLIGVSLPFLWKGTLYNCVAVLYQGEVLSLVPKKYIPNYGEYREWQYFRGADWAPDPTVRLFNQEIPFGWNILFQHVADPDLIVHWETCEDGWVTVPPSHLAALYGATLLLNDSASNVTGGKGHYRRILAQATSGMCNAIRAYVSAGRGETSTDMSWDNHMLVAERGAITLEEPRFQRVSHFAIHDADLGMIVADRRRQGTQADNRLGLEHDFGGRLYFRTIPFGQPRPEVSDSTGPFIIMRRRISPLPFVPDSANERAELCEEIHQIQAHALADRWETRPAGTKVVINFSGGKDSLNALGVCVHAARLIKRPVKDIICLTLPGYGTTPDTLAATRTIANAFGVDFREISIVGESFDRPLSDRDRSTWGLCDYLLHMIGHDGLTEDLTYENVQAWLRTVIALATSAKDGGFMVGTGTLSELAVGWCTMFGDHASHFGVNGGLAKTLEFEVLRWQADHVYGREQEVRDVIHWVCDEAASPELKRPGTSGKTLQSTDALIGPLMLRDFYMYWGVRFGTRPSKISRLALQAFEGLYSLSEINHWQRVYWPRFFAAQIKRNCLPESPKVGLVCFSPRGDWQMPSDADPTAWLADLDEVPESV